MEYNQVSTIVFQYLEGTTTKGQLGFLARCPFCGDSKKSHKKKRFHIDYYASYDTYVYKCYNGGCEESGDIFKLYAHVTHQSYTEAKKELLGSTYNSGKLKDKINGKKKVRHVEEVDTDKAFDIDIKNECIGLDITAENNIQFRYQQALKEFITERKIPIKCYIAHTGRYQGRFIIPIYQKGEIVYFQGRSMNDDIEPKYLNPDIEKESIIMNIDNFEDGRQIIVAEGTIDASMVEYNQGTTCLGASVSDDFLDVLFARVDDVIIALDNPFIDESGMKTMLKFIEKSKYARKVKYFLMPYRDIKDLNELVVKRCPQNVYNFVVENSFSYFATKTKLKLLK